jgi:hypothetical protein
MLLIFRLQGRFPEIISGDTKTILRHILGCWTGMVSETTFQLVEAIQIRDLEHSHSIFRFSVAKITMRQYFLQATVNLFQLPSLARALHSEVYNAVKTEPLMMAPLINIKVGEKTLRSRQHSPFMECGLC